MEGLRSEVLAHLLGWDAVQGATYHRLPVEHVVELGIRDAIYLCAGACTCMCIRGTRVHVCSRGWVDWWMGGWEGGWEGGRVSGACVVHACVVRECARVRPCRWVLTPSYAPRRAQGRYSVTCAGKKLMSFPSIVNASPAFKRQFMRSSDHAFDSPLSKSKTTCVEQGRVRW